jgi:hypothetical protein
MSDFREEFPDGDQEPVEAAEQQADLLSLQARESVEAAYEGSSLGSAADSDPVTEGPEGLLFTGDVIRSMTPDQIAAVGEFASRMFGVEMRPLHRIERELGGLAVAETGEEAPEPVPATKEYFRTWAAENGYTSMRACRSWNYLFYTTNSLQPGIPAWRRESMKPVPPTAELRWLCEYHTFDNDIEKNVIDLRKVRDFLVATGLDPRVWIRGNRDHVAFLVDLVNSTVQPEEPLQMRKRGKRA